MLTFEQFKALPDDEIFATGTLTDKALAPDEVRWVANKGSGYDDWAIYYHYSQHDVNFIRYHGDKVLSESIIRRLVPCDDQVYAKYRM